MCLETHWNSTRKIRRNKNLIVVHKELSILRGRLVSPHNTHFTWKEGINEPELLDLEKAAELHFKAKIFLYDIIIMNGALHFWLEPRKSSCYDVIAQLLVNPKDIIGVDRDKKHGAATKCLLTKTEADRLRKTYNVTL